MTNRDQLLDACRAADNLVCRMTVPQDIREAQLQVDLANNTRQQIQAAITAAESLEQPVDEGWLRSVGEDEFNGSFFFGPVRVYRCVDQWFFTVGQGKPVELKSRRQLLDLLSGLGVPVEVTL